MFTPATEIVQQAVQSRPYRDRYVKDRFGRRAAFSVGADAAIQHTRNSPHERGGGLAGFGKRLGSAFDQRVIKNSIQFGWRVFIMSNSVIAVPANTDSVQG